jgi:prolipoprotein diacylglyceryltransferase
MIILFIIEDYKNYYKNIKKNEKIENLNNISTFLKYIILILIIYGHVIYIIKQKNKFSTKFDIFKLYKGDKCIII